jgi:hypothetical protein
MPSRYDACVYTAVRPAVATSILKFICPLAHYSRSVEETKMHLPPLCRADCYCNSLLPDEIRQFSRWHTPLFFDAHLAAHTNPEAVLFQ